jgi:acyl-CoA synthetase (NDP forming)
MTSEERVTPVERPSARPSGAMLDGLLAPRAVTVVGASPNGYLTEHLLRNFANLSCRYRGPINFVNPSYRRLFGYECVPDVSAISGEIGVLYLLVAPDACLPVLESLPALPQCVVVFAEGSQPGAGARYEDEIARWGWEHSVPILGPQSNGLVIPSADFLGLVVPIVEDLRSGSVALLSQSGGILGGMVKYLSQRMVGIHSALEFGTGCMLSMEQLGHALLERDDVHVVAMYADGVASMTDFAAMLARAEQLRKIVIFMIGGSSDAGGRAAASHSGMATTPRAILSGLASQFGALQVATLDELVWSVEAIDAAGARRFSGDRVALFSDSGGADVVMADAISAVGLELVEPRPETKRALGVPETEPVNPVDFGSQSMGHSASVNHVIATVGADEQFGISAFASILGIPRNEQSVHLGQLADFAAEIAGLGKIPFIASLFPFLPTETAIQSAVIGMGSIESAVKLRALSALGDPISALVTDGPAATGAEGVEALEGVGSPAPVTGSDAEAALASLPLAWPASRMLDSIAELDSAAELPRYPLVVKSEAGLAHRAKLGGVLHGIEDRETLASAVAYLVRRFNGPVSVTETVPHTDEFFVGTYRTGAMVTLLFGPGGGQAEERAEVRVSPVSDAQFDRMVRPHAGLDAPKYVGLLRELERWMLDHPEVESVDLNPIILSNGELTALDAKIQDFAEPQR